MKDEKLFFIRLFNNKNQAIKHILKKEVPLQNRIYIQVNIIIKPNKIGTMELFKKKII